MLRWTMEAQRQLVDIKAYIERDNPGAATGQIRRIVQRAETLIEHTFIGRVLPELGNDGIRELLERPYRIVYTVIDNEPWILTVWHYRRLLKATDVQYRGA